MISISEMCSQWMPTGSEIEGGSWTCCTRRQADLGGEGVGEKVLGQAPDTRAVVHERPQESVEQVAPPLHIVLREKRPHLLRLYDVIGQVVQPVMVCELCSQLLLQPLLMGTPRECAD